MKSAIIISIREKNLRGIIMNDILNNLLESYRDEIVAHLQGCIRYPSVSEFTKGRHPYGRNVHRCLVYMLELAKAMGFKTCNVDNHVGWCEYGEGEEMVAVLGHLDVVPAGEGWSVPPFEGRIIDDKLYGRGTMDDKGPTMAALYGLYALKESGLPLKRRIRVIFGLSEENGGGDIAYYLEHGGEVPVMGFTPDGEYPVIHGEKGFIIEHYKCDYEASGEVVLTEISGGTAENVVPHQAKALIKCPENVAAQIAAMNREKITCTRTDDGVVIEAEGVNAHAATPWEGENAIQRLLLFLSELPLEGDQKRVMGFLAEKFQMECDGKTLGIAMKDEPSGPLTMNLGVISGDDKFLKVAMNYRYPVTKSYEMCEPIVKETFEAAGFTLVEEEHDPCLYMSTESELVKRLMKVYTEFTGDTESKPKCIGGATYAKALPNVLAFGPIFPGDEVREHKPDEYIEIDWLMKNAQMITEAMYALATD